jgi:hypothetical protein
MIPTRARNHIPSVLDYFFAEIFVQVATVYRRVMYNLLQGQLVSFSQQKVL